MKSFLLSSILLLLFNSNALATLYQWVDEDGNLQYTQTPPPGVEAQPVQPRLNSISSGEVDPPKLTPQQQLLLDSCQKAQQELQNLKSASNMMFPDPEEPGKFIPMSKETREQKMMAAETYLQANCQDTLKDQGTETNETPENSALSETAPTPPSKCEKVQASLTDLTTKTDLLVPDPENPEKYIPLGEEERQTKISELQSYFDQFCAQDD